MTLMTFVANVFWGVVALFSTLAFLVKFIAIGFSDGLGVALLYLFLISILLFLLFMLEGIQVSGIQVKSTDREGLERYLVSKFNPEQANLLRKIAKKFYNSFDDFIVGRQISRFARLFRSLSYFAQCQALITL